MAETTKAKTGRKPKLTPETQEKICNLIRAGHFKETAAAAAGVSPSAFHAWMKKGSKGNGAHADFRAAVELAEGQSELLLLDKILKEGGAKGALQILKRRFRERWGDRVGMEHTGKGGGPIKTEGTVGVQVVIGDQGGVWDFTANPVQPAGEDDIPDDDEDAA